MRLFTVVTLTSVVIFTRAFYVDHEAFPSVSPRSINQSFKDTYSEDLFTVIRRRTDAKDNKESSSSRDSQTSAQGRARRPLLLGRKQTQVLAKHLMLSYPVTSHTFKVARIRSQLNSKSSSRKEKPTSVLPEVMNQLKGGCKEVVDGICKTVKTITGALRGTDNGKGPPNKPKVRR